MGHSIRKACALVFGFTIALTACGSSPKPVTEAQLVATLNDVVTKEFGKPFDDLTCDRSLEPALGATATCTATAAGVQAEFDMKVISVDGPDVDFEWQFDEGSRIISQAAVQSAVAKTFHEQTGADLAEFDCPTDIPGQAGATVSCTATDSAGQVHGVAVAVTDAHQMSTRYDWTISPPK